MSKAAELLKMLSQCADERSPASKEIDMKINESWDLHNAQFKKDGLKLHKEHKSNPDGQNNTISSTVLHTVKLPDNSIMFITKHNDGKVFVISVQIVSLVVRLSRIDLMTLVSSKI